MEHKKSKGETMLAGIPDLIVDNSLRETLDNAKQNNTGDDWAKLALELNLRSMYRDARDAAEKALHVEPDHALAWHERILADALDMTRLKKLEQRLMEMEQTPVVVTNLALCAFMEENDNTAIDMINAALKEDDTLSFAWEIKGHLALSENKLEEAVDAFRQSIKLGNTHRAKRMLGEVMHLMGEEEEAKKILRDVVKDHPTFVQAWHELGEIFMEEDNFGVASQCFFRSLSINPKDWGSMINLADYFLVIDESDVSKSWVKQALLLEPPDNIAAELYAMLGAISLQDGDLVAAKVELLKANDLDPELALVDFNLGVLAENAGDEVSAQGYFHQAVEKDPQHTASWQNLGLIALNNSEIKQAEICFLKALETDEEDPWTYIRLADCYRISGRHEDQLMIIEKAMELAAEGDLLSSIYNHLGIALECLDRWEGAWKAYAKALEIAPFNRKAANNLGYLLEKKWKDTQNEEYQKAAIGAWKQRLLICRDTHLSVDGAMNHLLELGIEKGTIEEWLSSAVPVGIK